MEAERGDLGSPCCSRRAGAVRGGEAGTIDGSSAGAEAAFPPCISTMKRKRTNHARLLKTFQRAVGHWGCIWPSFATLPGVDLRAMPGAFLPSIKSYFHKTARRRFRLGALGCFVARDVQVYMGVTGPSSIAQGHRSKAKENTSSKNK
jgi:hypothetical protein